MEIFHDFQAKTALPKCAAIGCFDGMHLAHRAIFEKVLQQKSLGFIPTVIMIDSNPNKKMPALMTTEQKLAYLESIGIEIVYLLQFDQIKDIPADRFVTEILSEQCHVHRICCGFDFRFGKGGTADSKILQALCDSVGISVQILPSMESDGEAVSSTRIRMLIQQGKMEAAEQLLGNPFTITFPVQHGKKLGRKLGFPTMNQFLPESFVKPKCGVYCSSVLINGMVYCGLTNIGSNPTVGGTRIQAETWIQNFSGDLYGKVISVSLLSFLRDEKKFPSLEALCQQIEIDRQNAIRFFEKA